MNIVEEYIAYIKDNPEGYWFKRKLYGYGWVPATKSGWLTLLVYLAFVLSVTLHVPANFTEEQAAKFIIAPVLAATALLLVITWRMGEPLRWQWGKKRND